MLIFMKNRTCSVVGCDRPHFAKSYCTMHYCRVKRHGSTDDPRPEGFGEKRNHPLYTRWAQLRSRGVLCEEWKNFWRYIADVGEPPEGIRGMRRLDDGQPYGPTNFRWAEPLAGERKATYHREYNEKHYRRLKDKRLTDQYGIGMDEYDALLKAQGGGCAICHRSESEPTRRGGAKHKHLAVDHCHDTGVVRGLLCTDCNVAIGLLRDSPALCEVAAAYLVKGRKARAA